MPCCGNRRAQAGAAPALGREQRPRLVAPALYSPPPAVFEYTGKTSHAVTGPITRTIYRFPAPGARVLVDARDAAAVAAVPNVRRAAR
jgi:hypothetical protein